MDDSHHNGGVPTLWQRAKKALAHLWLKSQPARETLARLAERGFVQARDFSIATGTYYWTNRSGLGQFAADTLPLPKEEGTRREIHISVASNLSKASFKNNHWRIALPECCAICGNDCDSERINETRSVPKLIWPFWAPVVGVFSGMLLGSWFAAFWLLPLGLFGGLLMGYILREDMKVRLRYWRCARHVKRTDIPSVRVLRKGLIIGIGHRSVWGKYHQAVPEFYVPPRPVDRRAGGEATSRVFPASIPLAADTDEPQAPIEPMIGAGPTSAELTSADKVDEPLTLALTDNVGPPAANDDNRAVQPVADLDRRCPSCGMQLSADSTLCVECGHDFRIGGQRLHPVPRKQPETDPTKGSSLSWRSILQTPLRLEILRESVVQVLWCVGFCLGAFVIGWGILLALGLFFAALIYCEALPVYFVFGLVLSYLVLVGVSVKSTSVESSGCLFVIYCLLLLVADVAIAVTYRQLVSDAGSGEAPPSPWVLFGLLAGSHCLVAIIGWIAGACKEAGKRRIGVAAIGAMSLPVFGSLYFFVASSPSLLSSLMLVFGLGAAVLGALCFAGLVLSIALAYFDFFLGRYFQVSASAAAGQVRVPAHMFSRVRYWLGVQFCGIVVSPIYVILFLLLLISLAGGLLLSGVVPETTADQLIAAENFRTLADQIDELATSANPWQQALLSAAVAALGSALLFWPQVLYAMGVGAAALVPILNPLSVLRWIWRCRFDYLRLLVLMLPLTLCYGVAGFFVTRGIVSEIEFELPRFDIPQLLKDDSVFRLPHDSSENGPSVQQQAQALRAVMSQFFNSLKLAILRVDKTTLLLLASAVFVPLFLFHHFYVTLYTVLGLVLKHNKQRIGWS